MQRRTIATVVSFAYAIYWIPLLWRGLLRGLARPRVGLGPLLICALLALLCYGMAARRTWARGLGLLVGIGGIILCPLGIFGLYIFSGFSSRSGRPTFSLALVLPVLPLLLLSGALVVLLARPLVNGSTGDPPSAP
jgi:hypothetical protein